MHLRNRLLVGAGGISLAVGAVGIVVPILPTTPLVLLAAACFSTGSPRLRAWLEITPYFGHYIRNYKDKVGVPLRVKAVSLTFLWSVLAISAVALSFSGWMPMLLLVVGLCVTVHILTIRTMKEEALTECSDREA
jgi:uncharacterized membrane protein YbaN (DUF454 family)